MQTLFFRLIIFVSFFIRPFLSLFVFGLSFFIKGIKNRINFERLNLSDEACLSYAQNLPILKASVCFEVSSEGELEQVRPLIEECLKMRKKIEIIYSSPSVEKKCQLLYASDPKHIRILRMPLILSFPFNLGPFQSVKSWMTAPTVVFCRYDFFPELLSLKFKKKKFILISGATKKLGFYKKECFKLFDVVVAATDLEKNKFKKILKNKKAEIYSCDLRIPRIAKRHVNFVQTIKDLEYLDEYIEKISALELNEKIILGSAWPSDLKIFKNKEIIEKIKNKNLHITIAPHKLSEEYVAKLKTKCVEYFGAENVGVINKDHPSSEAPVVILQVGGILCELYGYFGLSYVGGGYERSIHSCLEPFFSGCSVICGPKTHRSTEYDYIKSNLPLEIAVLKKPELFYNRVKEMNLNARNLEKRRELVIASEEEMGRIFKEII